MEIGAVLPDHLDEQRFDRQRRPAAFAGLPGGGVRSVRERQRTGLQPQRLAVAGDLHRHGARGGRVAEFVLAVLLDIPGEIGRYDLLEEIADLRHADRLQADRTVLIPHDHDEPLSGGHDQPVSR